MSCQPRASWYVSAQTAGCLRYTLEPVPLHDWMGLLSSAVHAAALAAAS
jgi:hypothetical protein